MRVLFKKGEQKEFLDKILAEISVSEAANICDLSERTIRDWRREKFLPNEKDLRRLCKKSKINFPKNIELKNDYWYVSHSSSLGGRATYKKHGRIGGDPKYREKKWREWWKNKGRFRLDSICLPKSIQKPGYSVDLAEFIGIVMGDGSITKRQIQITLHSQDDKEYGSFIIKLIKKLFNVPTGKYYYKNCTAFKLVISRTALVEFCTNRLGLKIGDKMKWGLRVPDWILGNREFEKACLRGLIDTDGCIFNEKHTINNKIYNYKRLNFTSYSKALLEDVFLIFNNLGMSPRIRGNRAVQIEKKDEIRRYFKIIGTNNLKHLKRYKN